MNKEELFTELKNKKNKSDIAINLIKEINEKIENKTLTFTEQDSDEIYLYMFLCNKYEISDTLDKLINEVSFIELLDKTKIEGSILPSLTDVCQKPRKCLLKNSKKLKNSIIKGDPLLSTEDILADLTKEEIYILREDIEIDNYLISNGLSFSTLNKETIKRLLSDHCILCLIAHSANSSSRNLPFFLTIDIVETGKVNIFSERISDITSM